MLQRISVFLLIVLVLGGCRLREQEPAPQEQASAPMIPPPSDVAAPPADAHRTASGLASKILQVGASNVRPTASSTVTVHYTGWTPDGTMIDSSIPRGEPTTFPLGNVIPGWTEGVQLMVKGEKRRFWIPGELAYDTSDRPGSPKGMLVFDIELLEVE